MSPQASRLRDGHRVRLHLELLEDRTLLSSGISGEELLGAAAGAQIRTAIVSAVRGHKGKVYQTTVTPELEEELTKAMAKDN